VVFRLDFKTFQASFDKALASRHCTAQGNIANNIKIVRQIHIAQYRGNKNDQ